MPSKICYVCNTEMEGKPSVNILGNVVTIAQCDNCQSIAVSFDEGFHWQEVIHNNGTAKNTVRDEKQPD